MSWIKDNKFVVGLAGGTLAGVALLYWIGSNGQAQYQQALDSFNATKLELGSLEKVNPYPTAENRDAKAKALKMTHENLKALEESFQPYVVDAYKNITPEEFANHLKATHHEVREAFAAKKVRVPNAFYCGFEAYQSQLANGKATGVLSYELDTVKRLLLQLSHSGASELLNIHRPRLEEEDTGKPFEAKSGEVVQALPIELTFSGPESAMREFLGSLHGMKDRFVVVRAVRIANSHPDVPKASDAQFPKVEAASAEHADSGFVLPGETAKPATDKPVAEKPAEGGRMLAQVLGTEEVQVFVRLEILRFLPTKDRP